MINGVKIKDLKVWQDLPDLAQEVMSGILMEVVRDDDGLLKRFGQSTFSIAHHGTIKAFHAHEKQDDLWFMATGRSRIVLHDLRNDSPTYGKTQVILAGANDYKVVLIPAGVLHGYQVLSDEPVLLFYLTTEHYNAKSPDEIRYPWDDPMIGFDWQK